MPTKCPYCGIRDRTSDEHIFPEFLGGKATIRACKPCNDALGHSTEGIIANDLAPVMVLLRAKAQVRTSRLVVWKEAFVDPSSGVEYDLDSNLGARASKPIVEKNESGKVSAVFFHDDRDKRKFAAAAARKGKSVEIIDQPERKIPMPELNVNVSFSDEMRRMAVKMAVAVSDYLGADSVLDSTARAFLLREDQDTGRTIRDTSIYESLEQLRPPLSHVVYVEGDSGAMSCVAVVQLYGILQIRILLNDGNYRGPSIGYLALLDVVDRYSETFKAIDPLRLARPNLYQDYVAAMERWNFKWAQELREVTGDPSAEILVKEVVPKPFAVYSTTASRTVFITPPLQNDDC